MEVNAVVEVEAYIQAIGSAGARLAAAARDAGVEAPVPTCPGWTVADLLQHTGGVHRWATSYVRTGRADETTAAEERLFFCGPAADRSADLLAWFEEGVADLVSALAGAEPGLSCWTFLPAATPLGFWARRQAHETSVHYADAQAAAGVATRFPGGLAADGIDELLLGFFARPGRGPTSEQPQTLGLVATDTGERWSVRIGPDGPSSVRAGAEPLEAISDCVVSGAVSDLYLSMWNRLPVAADLHVSGERSILDRWHAAAVVTWS